MWSSDKACRCMCRQFRSSCKLACSQGLIWRGRTLYVAGVEEARASTPLLLQLQLTFFGIRLLPLSHLELRRHNSTSRNCSVVVPDSPAVRLPNPVYTKNQSAILSTTSHLRPLLYHCLLQTRVQAIYVVDLQETTGSLPGADFHQEDIL